MINKTTNSKSETIPNDQKRKHEIRSTKLETNSNVQINRKFSNNFNLDSVFWIFFGFGFTWRRFVSVRGAAFDIRISDFVSLASRRENNFCH